MAIPKLAIPGNHHTKEPGDSVMLDGFHYFLSKHEGEWAILHAGHWVVLDDRFVFTYVGHDKSHIGHSTWKVIRKPGTPKLPPGSANDEDLQDYHVKAQVNAHVDVLDVKARSAKHAGLLAMSSLSDKLGLPISELRARMWQPDALQIELKD